MFERGVQIKRVDARLLDYDLDRLAAAVDASADLDFEYVGLRRCSTATGSWSP